MESLPELMLPSGIVGQRHTVRILTNILSSIAQDYCIKGP
jgi:hypothetical protein